MSGSASSFVESLEARMFLAAGSLVPGFGEHGIAIPKIVSSYDDVPIDAAMGADGKIVILGESGPSGARRHALVRFNPDGALDASFGNAGWVMFSELETPVAVAVQPDGKIVVAGTTSGVDSAADGQYGYETTGVIRFNVNGARDATFSVGRYDTHGDVDSGRLSMSARMIEAMPDGGLLLGYEVHGVATSLVTERLTADGQTIWKSGGADAIAIQDDGAVLFGGFAYGIPATASIQRTKADGAADAAFGTSGGRALLTFSPVDVAVQSDRIKAVGFSGALGRTLAIQSLTLTGQPDASFGSNGLMEVSLPQGVYTSADVLPDRSILVVGRASSTDSHLVVAHYSAAGQFDNAFGQNGVLTTGLTGSLNGLFARPAGTFTVVAGAESTLTNGDFAGERYAISGAPASKVRFGGDFPGLGSTHMVASAAIPGGNTAVLGTAEGVLSLMRFGNDGKLLKKFGAGGIVRGLPFGSQVAADQQGRIYVAGISGNNILVRRQLANGSTDKKFGKSGTASAGAWGHVEQDPPYITSIQTQADSSVLIGFQTRRVSYIARLTSDGKLDARFGTKGVVSLASVTGPMQALDLAVQPDGRILALRHIVTGRSILMRLLSNGRRDATFGSKGMVDTGWDPRYVILEPDGRIVLSGQAYNNATHQNQVLLVRYDERGRLDRKFGTRGRAAYVVGNKSVSAPRLAVQDDGKILAGVGDAMVRFNVNGRIDSAFGKKGVFAAKVGAQKTAGSVLDIMVRRNGDIITAGNAGSDLYLARVRA